MSFAETTPRRISERLHRADISVALSLRRHHRERSIKWKACEGLPPPNRWARQDQPTRPHLWCGGPRVSCTGPAEPATKALGSAGKKLAACILHTVHFQMTGKPSSSSRQVKALSLAQDGLCPLL
jgi:hypothetical protein